MLRPLVVTLGFAALAAAVAAQPPAEPRPAEKRVAASASAPERLLSPTTQVYFRWDGVTPHNAAYKASVWGGVMAGPTGDSIRTLISLGQKYLGNNVLAEPLLDGKAPAELKANLADLKKAGRIVDLIADTGVIFAAEVKEPKPTLKGVASVLGSLVGGKPPAPDSFVPNVTVLAIVPDAGDRADILEAVLRLAAKKTEIKLEPFEHKGRKGFRLGEAPSPGAAFWKEDKHFVLYIGTRKPEDAIEEIAANQVAGGLTEHSLYRRCIADPGYETVARGFVDTARLTSLVKGLVGPFVPGLSQRIDDLGLSNLSAVVFSSGFAGKESRATYDFDLRGERKGFARVLKSQPLSFKDLPPLPSDVSRFSALRIDPSATYDAAISALEALSINQSFGSEEEAKTPADAIRLRREYLLQQVDKELGLSVKNDVLPHIGDKFVLYQSPTEGLSTFGTVACISLKDPTKAQVVLDRIQRGMESIIGAPVKVRKRVLKGVEIRELYSRNFLFLTPTYAVAGDWLVVAGNPQCVQGFVLRARGELPSWAPDRAIAARLAELPADDCGFQFCDPRSTVKNLCCIGPLGLSTLNNLGILRSGNDDADYNPFDTGLIPNGHELSSHLFPNLTVTRHDERGIHVHVSESFSLPLEFLGFEPLAFFGILGPLGAIN